MRYLSISLSTCALLLASCTFTSETVNPAERTAWAIAIHGGAGHITREYLTADRQAQYSAGLDEALQTGIVALENGASAVDVVEAVISVLEDDSLFNAGRGAVFTSEGVNELDASIADGRTRNCGAITGIQGFRNPISVARLVMDSSEHVFFSSHGASEFASKMGCETASPEWFHTDKAYGRYLKAHERETAQSESQPLEEKRGTVGCVVFDSEGNLAAGTSTGGMTYKRHGRIGDSPVIGAGTWADNRTCAISATGWGEYFIRTGVAQDIHSQMLHAGTPLEEACRKTIFDEMGVLGGDGGVIAVDAQGNISLIFNSNGMFRAWATPDFQKIAMFRD